jgi:hypothetical protein
MTFHANYSLDVFSSKLHELRKARKLSNPDLVEEIVEYIREIDSKLQKDDASWQDFTTFWPPRCINALRQHQGTIFFGAGLSLACGIPPWNRLLSENFGLDKSLTDDEELAHDPLTMAELASQYKGSEALQEILRRIMSESHKFSINHAALAAVRCPVYITTNYDCLFEAAWEKINPSKLEVVTNDADLLTKSHRDAESNGNSILFKIHGSCDRIDEYMILTRRDYRFHYRQNAKLFQKIRTLLRERHTIFVGFSHKDPEVSRLVEDAIYDYEKENPTKLLSDTRPQFYSLQFGMSSHTPEIFAARGIVALQPPAITTSFENVKSKALAVALADLIGSKQYDLHRKVMLSQELGAIIECISKEIQNGLNTLSNYSEEAQKTLTMGVTKNDWMDNLLDELGDLASQGVYLLNDQGGTADYTVPKGLNKSLRVPKRPLNTRPYFQQAKSFREPFLSDSDASIFTKQSTAFLCAPVLKNDLSIGLLFSALQIGQWKTPYKKAEELWKNHYSFLLIDSNGVCLLPPFGEIEREGPEKPLTGEVASANIGYRHARLKEFSRNDTLVRHISKNVIPITQDDDVLEISKDLKQFSVVSELPHTRWKIAVSIPVHAK